MRTIALIFLSTFLIVGCSSENSDETVSSSDSLNTLEPEVDKKERFNTDELLGQYMGSFGKSTLIIKLNYVKGKNASGYNVVRGNKRNIKGSVSADGENYHFVLDEPGDNNTDGKFEFDININSFILTGNWTPKNPQYAKEKSFELKKINQSEPDESMLKEWYGTINEQYGTLILKKDGTCLFKGSNYNESRQSYTEFMVKGTWLEGENLINLELESNPYTKFTQLKLNKIQEGDEEYSSWVLEDKDKAAFYEYF